MVEDTALLASPFREGLLSCAMNFLRSQPIAILIGFFAAVLVFGLLGSFFHHISDTLSLVIAGMALTAWYSTYKIVYKE
jgi:hypothetical protein